MSTITLDTIIKIRKKIKPYDLFVAEANGKQQFVFRKPSYPSRSTAPALIARGYDLVEYLRVHTEAEAVKEVKRLLNEVIAARHSSS